MIAGATRGRSGQRAGRDAFKDDNLAGEIAAGRDRGLSAAAG
jgi:hypothetical protein